MFEAANAFDRAYHGLVPIDAAPAGASRDAAVAQAAHDVLMALLPSQTATFDALLATSLAGLDQRAARDGAAVGAAAASAVLELRAGDGWERPFPALPLPSLPGYYVPTPRPTPPRRSPTIPTSAASSCPMGGSSSPKGRRP